MTPYGSSSSRVCEWTTAAREVRRRSGAATKAAVLEAARAHFGEDGGEDGHERAIAAGAGADPAMVMRRFGSKERLVAAAGEADLGLPDLRGTRRARRSRRRSRAASCRAGSRAMACRSCRVRG